jgi:hypothetical protein
VDPGTVEKMADEVKAMQPGSFSVLARGFAAEVQGRR